MELVLINAAIDIALLALAVLIFFGLKKLFRKKARKGGAKSEQEHESQPAVLGSNATSPVFGPFQAPRTVARNDSENRRESD